MHRVRAVLFLALAACALTAAPAGAAVTAAPDGKIITAGGALFDQLATQYAPSGSLDRGFDRNGYSRIPKGIFETKDVTRLTDGRIVALGSTRGAESPRLVVVKPNGRYGSLLPAGAGTGMEDGYLTPLSGGGVLVAATLRVDGCGRGAFSTVAMLARLDAGLNLDPSFGGDGIVTAPFDYSVCPRSGPTPRVSTPAVVSGDGTIVVAGGGYVGRFLPNGDPDPSFGGDGAIDGPYPASGLVVEASGRIVVASAALAVGEGKLEARRYLPDGTADGSYGNGDGVAALYLGSGFSVIGTTAPDAQSRLIAAVSVVDCVHGSLVAICSSILSVVRLTTDGTLDTTFGGGDGIVRVSLGASGSGLDLASPGDRIVLEAGGDGGFQSSTLLAFTPGGALDENFGKGGVRLPPRLPSVCANRRIRSFDSSDFGTPENDSFFYTDRGKTDVVHGLGGRDLIRLGNAPGDWACGDWGPDRLTSDAGTQYLSGGPGRDRLSSGRSRDVLRGGSGRDVIAAGPGNDRIFARDGRRDIVRCGSGRDVVVADRFDRLTSCERRR